MNKIKFLFVLLGMCMIIPNMSAQSNDTIQMKEGLLIDGGDFLKKWEFKTEDKKARDIYNSKISSTIEVAQKNGGEFLFLAYIEFEGDRLGFYLDEKDIDDILSGLSKLNSQLEADMNTPIRIKNTYKSISGVIIYYNVKKAKFSWYITHKRSYAPTFRLRDDFNLVEFFNDLKTRIAEAKKQLGQQ